jgi:hypothetical protein
MCRIRPNTWAFPGAIDRQALPARRLKRLIFSLLSSAVWKIMSATW